MATRAWPVDRIIFLRCVGIAGAPACHRPVDRPSNGGLDLLGPVDWRDAGKLHFCWLRLALIRNQVFLLSIFGSLIFSMVKWPAHGSGVLHANALRGLFNSSAQLIQTHGFGFFLNRFSTDQWMIEVEFSRACTMALSIGIELVTNIALVLAGTAYAAVIFVLLAIFVESARRLYGPTSRQLRALESSTKTPLYQTCAELNESSALQSFRCYHAQSALKEAATQAIDDSNVPFLLLRLVRVWLIVLAASLSRYTLRPS
jgi:hypothetical protein